MGAQTIFFLEDILSSTNFFFMDMGTMLGIIREGRILGHDLDIDIAVYVESDSEKERLKSILLDAGCKLKWSFLVEGLGIVEESFIYNDLKFDINYYTREENRDVCYLMYHDPDLVYPDNEMSVVKLSVSSVSCVKKVPFLGREVTVPEDPEKYLSERYGENWRIPDTKYVYWKGPSCEPTDYKGYAIKGES